MKVNIGRIGVFFSLFVIMGIVSVWRIVDLQFIHKPEKSNIARATTKEEVVECIRGSIIADDGNYLAFSIPEYRICMDCMQPKDNIFEANIDSLCLKLAAFYKDKSAKEYKTLITSQRKSNRRYTIINKRRVNYQEMKEISTFPLFRLGKSQGGLIVEKFDHREYPYGKLAFRTLGYIRNNQERPTIGLEGSCDSILRGKNGVQPIRLTEHNNWIADNEREFIPPVNGTDIQTTLNINIQDIAENALRRVIKDNPSIKGGTAIVMEVATGEIKAMVNLEKNKGGFEETYNFAIGRTGEPGSVFKLATLTVLLEDKKIKLDQTIKAVVNWSYRGKPLPPDLYLRNYDTISVRRGFEISSNNVFRMLAAKYYDENPGEFIRRLGDLHISDNYDFDLNGFGKAKIKTPQDKSWSPVDLPQIAMGYTLELTPLHTLTYYNAVANKGVMVKPHLIRNYQKNRIIEESFETETIAKVCSESTAKELHRAMRGVVTHGTGRLIFKDCKVSVAGKTGTARIIIPGLGRYQDNMGRKMHQATFAGFFPFEDPKYSAIVVVYSELTSQNFYGGTWAAPVVREIAENIYACSPDWSAPITPTASLPAVEEYHNYSINDTLQGVPNVLGMGLRSAINTLESKGYSVSFSGTGKIVSQSPAPGAITESKEITILLSNNNTKKHDETK